MREATQSAALAPESAAVSTTKFMTAAAWGILTVWKVVTNGLSVTPAWFQGMTPRRTTMAPTYRNVRVRNVSQTARGVSLEERDSPEGTATISTPPKL